MQTGKPTIAVSRCPAESGLQEAMALSTHHHGTGPGISVRIHRQCRTVSSSLPIPIMLRHAIAGSRPPMSCQNLVPDFLGTGIYVVTYSSVQLSIEWHMPCQMGFIFSLAADNSFGGAPPFQRSIQPYTHGSPPSSARHTAGAAALLDSSFLLFKLWCTSVRVLPGGRKPTPLSETRAFSLFPSLANLKASGLLFNTFN